MTLSAELRDQTMRWIADDPDPETRAELQAVLAAAMTGDTAASKDLADRMSSSLTFGTAGLRGPVRAGQHGMNRAVVIKATAGLATWLTDQGMAGGVVVVGRDARHGSEEFCRAAAGVLAAAGFLLRVLNSPMPTPVLAFAVRKMSAVAGIQITASHNPSSDNGYKVYLDQGAQLVPPSDRQIEAAIALTGAACDIPVADTWLTVPDDVVSEYLDLVAALPRGPARQLRIALTALHGVGGAIVEKALRQAGFTDLHVVTEQWAPDPDFPTVAFPNPEEPGTTDLLIDVAAKANADVAIALDPDADRCAVGICQPDGSWRMLRGDETGALLGDYILSTQTDPNALVATTIVSSTLLADIAKSYGVRYAETLTGFKWLMRAGDGMGTGLVYAYEEALGHCVDPAHVRDKDGISAAVLSCDLAATAKAAGRTLLDLMNDLAIAHGVHLTDQISMRVAEVNRLNNLMTILRSAPPAMLAGIPVSAEDLRPKADVFALRGQGIRVMVRPSGTEPKIKAYLEVTCPVHSPDDLSATQRLARERLNSLRQDVIRLFDL